MLLKIKHVIRFRVDVYENKRDNQDTGQQNRFCVDVIENKGSYQNLARIGFPFSRFLRPLAFLIPAML
jgi:hypothetical protein